MYKMKSVFRSYLRIVFYKQSRSSQFRFLSRLASEDNTRSNNHETNGNFKKTPLLVGVTFTTFLGFYFFDKSQRYAFADKLHDISKEKVRAGEICSELPFYSMQDVSKHTTKETRIWVVYKNGVYDVTEFVEQHPGGNQIMIAAGSSVEPFWELYGVHKNSQVYELMETLRIGNLKDEDKVVDFSQAGDPYANDPKRHPALKPANIKPFNAEGPRALLCESFITPNDLYFVRNHLPVPEIDPMTYELEIEVEGTNKSVSFSLEQLKKFPKTTITATLMCSGNRRSDMHKVKPVKGLSWGPCAIGNATWTGVRLRDLLKQVGVTEDEDKYQHVQFEGLDFDATGTQYGASIPIWKAVDKRGDVILAYEMNGLPLPRDHGYPVRVIVPGTTGARNVKWLGKIVVSENESSSHWQQNDYKGFCPSTDWDTADFSKSPAIQEVPVISAICIPQEGDRVRVENGCIKIKGYAWSGGGQKIVRVDVTADGGKTWHVASLDAQDASFPPRHWAWTLWSLNVPVDPKAKEVEIWCKAVDSCYNTQPEKFENIWNFRGVLSNAYHRVKVNLSQ